jgi:hypothetical protein
MTTIDDASSLTFTLRIIPLLGGVDAEGRRGGFYSLEGWPTKSDGVGLILRGAGAPGGRVRLILLKNS